MLVPLAVLLGALFAASAAGAQDAAFPNDEAYLRYLGNEPGKFARDWTDNVNGVSHDETHWYFAQEEHLYRVPLSVSVDTQLRIPVSPYYEPDYPWVALGGVPALDAYHHFGDISYYAHGGRGYVLTAIDKGPPGEPPLLAIFRGDDSLALVHAVGIPDQLGSDGRGTAAFAAVDSQGRIYSMGRGRCANDPDASCLRRYSLDWDAVAAGAVDGLALSLETEIPLYDANGQPILLGSLQGAVVTPSDRVIYLANGYNCGSVNRGLHAFDLATGRELARSSQSSDDLFRFQFDCEPTAGRISEVGNQEPEGLTYWDLDGIPNPDGIRGQIHVLVLDNDAYGYDHVYFKHYSGRLYVDPAASSGDGGVGSPYPSIADALGRGATPPSHDRPAAWGGSTVVLAPGSYPAQELAADAPGVYVRAGVGGSATLGP
jgi:hypothetical protein